MLVNSVFLLSARSAQTPNELASAVSTRLSALAQAHELTVPNGLSNEQQPTTLHTLIRAIRAPYSNEGEAAQSRTIIRELDLSVRDTSVTSFALLLHEFATNLAK